MAEGYYCQQNGSHLMKEIYDQFLVCKICFEQYRNPKTLSCMHVFCCLCLEKHHDAELERSYRYTLYSRAVSCPVCRKKTELPPGGIRRLQESFLVSNLTKVINRKKPYGDRLICEICTISPSPRSSRSPEAVSKCLECCKLLCFRCVRSHKNTNVTQQHSLYDINVEKDIQCKIHDDEMIRYYCEDCEQCICILCTFQEHKGHDITSFSDGFQKYQMSMEMLANRCKTKVVDIRRQLDIINKCEYEFKNTEEQIHDQSIEAISTVRRLQQEFTRDLHDVYGDESFAYLNRKVILQEALETLLSTCKYTDVMENKSIELLLIKKKMQDKLEASLQQPLFQPPTQLFKEVKFNPQPFSFGYLDVVSKDCDDIYFRSKPGIATTCKGSKIQKTICSKCNEGIQSSTTSSTNTTPWHQILNTILPSTTMMSSLLSGQGEYTTPSSRLSVASPSTSRAVSPSIVINREHNSNNSLVTDYLPISRSTSHSCLSSSSSDTMYSLDQFTNATSSTTIDMVSNTVYNNSREQSTDTLDLNNLVNRTTSTPVINMTHCGTTTDSVALVNRSTLTQLLDMSDKMTSTNKSMKIDRETMALLTPMMFDIGVNTNFVGEDKSVGTITTVFCNTGLGDDLALTKDQSIETTWKGMIVPSREQTTSTSVIVFSRSTSPHNFKHSVHTENVSLINEIEYDSDNESAFTYTDDESYMDDSDTNESEMSLETAPFRCPHCKHDLSEPITKSETNNDKIINHIMPMIDNIDSIISRESTSVPTNAMDEHNSTESKRMSCESNNIVSLDDDETNSKIYTRLIKKDMEPRDNFSVGFIKQPQTVSKCVSNPSKSFVDAYTFMPFIRTRNICTITHPASHDMKDSGSNTDRTLLVDRDISVQPIMTTRDTCTPKIYSRDMCTGTKAVSIETRGCSPLRVSGVDMGTITIHNINNKCLETTRVLFSDMACDSISFRGDDKGIMAVVETKDEKLDAFLLDSREQGVCTVHAKTYNSGTSMEPITYSSKESLTTKIHMMNKNVSTDNLDMVDKQTTTIETDITAEYIGALQNQYVGTITRGTTMVTTKFVTRDTSPMKEVQTLRDRASSPVTFRNKNKATNVDRADFLEQDKFHQVGCIDGDGQSIRKAPSLDTIREASQESSLDLDDEDDNIDILEDQPTSVSLSSAISTILTHIESFCATSYNKDGQCESTFSSSTGSTKNNVSSILCRVEQGTSTQCVATEDKAISTESISVDGKMLDCINKLKTVRHRLEQHHIGDVAFSPLYSKADSQGGHATTISSSVSASITAPRPIASVPQTFSPGKSSGADKLFSQISMPLASPPLIRKEIGPGTFLSTSHRSKARKQRLDLSDMLCSGTKLNSLSSEMPQMKSKSKTTLCPLYIRAHNISKLSLKDSAPCKSPPLSRKICETRTSNHRQEHNKSVIQSSSSEESLPKPVRAKLILTREVSSLDYDEHDPEHPVGAENLLTRISTSGESSSFHSVTEDEQDMN